MLTCINPGELWKVKHRFAVRNDINFNIEVIDRDSNILILSVDVVDVAFNISFLFDNKKYSQILLVQTLYHQLEKLPNS